MRVIEGKSSLIQAFSNHVGIQSSAHEDEGDFITILRIVSSTSVVKWLNSEVGGDEDAAWFGRDDILSSLSFTFSIFSTKKRAKSSASCSGSSRDGRALAVVEEHNCQQRGIAGGGHSQQVQIDGNSIWLSLEAPYISYIDLGKCPCEPEGLIWEIVSHIDVSRVLHHGSRRCTTEQKVLMSHSLLLWGHAGQVVHLVPHEIGHKVTQHHLQGK